MKRATEVLVKAAQQAKQRDEDEDIDVAVDSRKVGGIKQVRHARSLSLCCIFLHVHVFMFLYTMINCKPTFPCIYLILSILVCLIAVRTLPFDLPFID